MQIRNKLIQKLYTENTKLNAIIETKELKCLELELRVNNDEFNTNTESNAFEMQE